MFQLSSDGATLTDSWGTRTWLQDRSSAYDGVATIPPQAAYYALSQSSIPGGGRTTLSGLVPVVSQSCYSSHIFHGTDYTAFGGNYPELNSLILGSEATSNSSEGKTASGLDFTSSLGPSVEGDDNTWLWYNYQPPKQKPTMLKVSVAPHTSTLSPISTLMAATKLVTMTAVIATATAVPSAAASETEQLSTSAEYDVTACVVEAAWRHAWLVFESQVLSVQSASESNQALPLNEVPIEMTPQWAREVFRSYWSQQSIFTFNPTLQYIPAILSLGLSDACPIRDFCTQQIYVPGHAPTTVFESIPPNTTPDTAPWISLGKYLKKHHLYSDQNYISVTDLADVPAGSSCFTPIGTNQTSRLGPTHWSDPSSLTRFSINVVVDGIGYDHRETAVKLSIAVLSLYAAITIVCLFVTIVLTGRTATSWVSIGEVLALALNTQRPGHMLNTSVGVDLYKTYSKPVNVRVNEGGSVEMVFEDDASVHGRAFRMVEANERY